jgi:hypothetical protein
VGRVAVGQRCSPPAQGAAKNKSVTPVVGGWVGQIYMSSTFFFLMVLLNSPHREKSKNVIPKTENKLVLDFSSISFVKTVRHVFFVKRFLRRFVYSHR